jgi:transcriptional regulator with XRE-family HTH domain
MVKSTTQVGLLLKNARERRNLTQEDLAKKVGKKRSYISRIERQEGNHININTLIEIVEKGLDSKITIEF